MDADRLSPGLRRAVTAAASLDEQLLILLFARKAEPVSELVEILGAQRGPAMAALGRLSQERLVAHQRSEEGVINWFATGEGRTRGEQMLRRIAAGLAAEPAPASAPAASEAAAEEPGEGPDHERLKARRRVSIDQNEKTGFSWD